MVCKNGGVEIDNCSNKPKQYQKPALTINRHTTVEVPFHKPFGESKLKVFHANDSAVYPFVLVEGLLLHQTPDGHYYSVFDDRNKPSSGECVTWIVSLHSTSYEYEDYNLMIDNGKQLNPALRRADYPVSAKTLHWNEIHKSSSNSRYSVLDTYDRVWMYQEVYPNMKCKFTTMNQCVVKGLGLFVDDIKPGATSNFNESVTVYAYRFLDEPGNKPVTLGLKYAHTGGSIMMNAIENELILAMTVGCIVMCYDLQLKKCVPKWVVFFLSSLESDRPQTAKNLGDAGATGKHSCPRVLGSADDLHWDGKSPHYHGYLPDCAINKTKGYDQVCVKAIKESKELFPKYVGPGKTSCGLSSACDIRPPLCKILDDKGCWNMDVFHGVVGGLEELIIKAIVGLITKRNSILNKLLTMCYEGGTTLAKYQSRVPISCYSKTKSANKFVDIYNACFVLVEILPL